MSQTDSPPGPAEQLHVVLVVEDEALIRSGTCNFLQRRGFQVLEADSASAALSILADHPKVDLVFSDVQTPGPFDGFDLDQWVRENRPATHVILTSGSEAARQRAKAACPDRPFFPKPYTGAVVARQIAALLKA